MEFQMQKKKEVKKENKQMQKQLNQFQTKFKQTQELFKMDAIGLTNKKIDKVSNLLS